MVITGEINFRGEVTFPLTLRDAIGGTHEYTVVLDTGFDGDLTLPQSIVDALALPKAGVDTFQLADGTIRSLPLYEVTVVWFKRKFIIKALLTEGVPLVGQRLTRGCFITHHAEDGGAVITYRPQ